MELMQTESKKIPQESMGLCFFPFFCFYNGREKLKPQLQCGFSLSPVSWGLHAGSDQDLGNLVSTLNSTCHIPQTIPDQFLQCGRAHYPAEKGPLLLENTIAMKGCTWSATMFSQPAHVTVTST